MQESHKRNLEYVLRKQSEVDLRANETIFSLQGLRDIRYRLNELQKQDLQLLTDLHITAAFADAQKLLSARYRDAALIEKRPKLKDWDHRAELLLVWNGHTPKGEFGRTFYQGISAMVLREVGEPYDILIQGRNSHHITTLSTNDYSDSLMSDIVFKSVLHPRKIILNKPGIISAIGRRIS